MSAVQVAKNAWLRALDAFGRQQAFDLPNAPPGFCPEAWFLGPKGENRDLLDRLIREAIDSHVRHRQEFHVGDPEVITGAVKQSHEYAAAVRNFEREARRLFEYLQWSAPVSSMRHQGHMLWDQVLPAVVGYFAAMLYNQNNVAAEASPITTLLELRVGEDLCRMLGYRDRLLRKRPALKATPWGHITCGGTVANIEALWAVRNAKFFAFAMAEGLKTSPALKKAQSIRVRTARSDSKRLVHLAAWDLLNLSLDESISLPERIEKAFGITAAATHEAVSPYLLPQLGLVQFARHFPDALAKLPVVLVPATAHYSWPKAATLLGLGGSVIRPVPVDFDARMDMAALRDELQRCLETQTPVMAVVAVIGSTEQSAVDPLESILELRDDFQRRGLYFAVHCDAAWGGYFAAMLHETSQPPIVGVPPPRTPADGVEDIAYVPHLPMSNYVRRQFRKLARADSITIDPHKGGYVPYPAGALCYSNSAMRNMMSLRASVVFHSKTEPTVGIYGVEGSKPGAAAAAVWLAHRVIRPTRAGYGSILERCMWTAIRLYCRLLTLDKKWLKVVTLPDLPAGFDIKRIRRIARLPNDEFKRELQHSELGPDLVICAFACNFTKRGKPNDDQRRMNEFNRRIFERCSATQPKDHRDDESLELILTASDFDPAVYGEQFVRSLCDRLGARFTRERLDFLISTSMDPWRTDTVSGDFLQTLEEAFLRAAASAARDMGGDCD